MSQLTQGAWPFALIVVIPGIVAVVALVWQALKGERESGWLDVLVPVIWAMMGPLIGVLTSAMKPSTGRTATCSWIALGDDYIRLGMSFLRSKILFGQIIDVERGTLRRGMWTPVSEGVTVPEPPAADDLDAAPPGALGPPPGLHQPKLAPPPAPSARSRIRVRLVMRRTWEVMSFAYPASIDPSGELTTTLELAASRTRNWLRLGEGLSDDDLTARYRDLETRYREQVEAEPGTDRAAPEPEFPGYGWTPPQAVSPPKPERLPDPVPPSAAIRDAGAPEAPRGPIAGGPPA